MDAPQQLDRTISQLEASARFLESHYLEAIIEQSITRATVAAQSPWLNREAAAQYWFCSTKEIDRAAKAGILTRHERGDTPMFLKAEGDEKLRAGRWKIGRQPKLKQAA